MNNFIIKILVAIISFMVGISAFNLSSNVRLPAASDTSNFIAPNLEKKELSNKVEVRFVRFVQERTQVEAEFEITNGITEDIYYVGYDKNNYAFPTLKRNGKVVPDKRFYCGTGLKEHKLSSGEVVFFRVLKLEATYEPAKDSWGETDKPTQIGFSFEIDNKNLIKVGERQKEIFWSDEIKFPD